MRLTKTQVWAIGILLLLMFFAFDRALILVRCDYGTGRVVGYYNVTMKRSSRVPKINFTFEGNSYTFLGERFSSAHYAQEVPILFDPENPQDAFEINFEGFWMWSLIYLGIAFIPWSAASLSFIGKYERLVISRKKIGLEKVKTEY